MSKIIFGFGRHISVAGNLAAAARQGASIVGDLPWTVKLGARQRSVRNNGPGLSYSSRGRRLEIVAKTIVEMIASMTAARINIRIGRKLKQTGKTFPTRRL